MSPGNRRFWPGAARLFSACLHGGPSSSWFEASPASFRTWGSVLKATEYPGAAAPNSGAPPRAPWPRLPRFVPERPSTPASPSRPAAPSSPLLRDPADCSSPFRLHPPPPTSSIRVLGLPRGLRTTAVVAATLNTQGQTPRYQSAHFTTSASSGGMPDSSNSSGSKSSSRESSVNPERAVLERVPPESTGLDADAPAAATGADFSPPSVAEVPMVTLPTAPVAEAGRRSQRPRRLKLVPSAGMRPFRLGRGAPKSRPTNAAEAKAATAAATTQATVALIAAETAAQATRKAQTRLKQDPYSLLKHLTRLISWRYHGLSNPVSTTRRLAAKLLLRSAGGDELTVEAYESRTVHALCGSPGDVRFWLVTQIKPRLGTASPISTPTDLLALLRPDPLFRITPSALGPGQARLDLRLGVFPHLHSLDLSMADLDRAIRLHARVRDRVPSGARVPADDAPCGSDREDCEAVRLCAAFAEARQGCMRVRRKTPGPLAHLQRVIWQRFLEGWSVEGRVRFWVARTLLRASRVGEEAQTLAAVGKHVQAAWLATSLSALRTGAPEGWDLRDPPPLDLIARILMDDPAFGVGGTAPHSLLTLRVSVLDPQTFSVTATDIAGPAAMLASESEPPGVLSPVASAAAADANVEAGQGLEATARPARESVGNRDVPAAAVGELEGQAGSLGSGPLGGDLGWVAGEEEANLASGSGSAGSAARVGAAPAGPPEGLLKDRSPSRPALRTQGSAGQQRTGEQGERPVQLQEGGRPAAWREQLRDGPALPHASVAVKQYSPEEAVMRMIGRGGESEAAVVVAVGRDGQGVQVRELPDKKFGGRTNGVAAVAAAAAGLDKLVQLSPPPSPTATAAPPLRGADGLTLEAAGTGGSEVGLGMAAPAPIGADGFLFEAEAELDAGLGPGAAPVEAAQQQQQRTPPYLQSASELGLGFDARRAASASCKLSAAAARLEELLAAGTAAAPERSTARLRARPQAPTQLPSDSSSSSSSAAAAAAAPNRAADLPPPSQLQPPSLLGNHFGRRARAPFTSSPTAAATAQQTIPDERSQQPSGRIITTALPSPEGPSAGLDPLSLTPSPPGGEPAGDVPHAAPSGAPRDTSSRAGAALDPQQRAALAQRLTRQAALVYPPDSGPFAWLKHCLVTILAQHGQPGPGLGRRRARRRQGQGQGQGVADCAPAEGDVRAAAVSGGGGAAAPCNATEAVDGVDTVRCRLDVVDRQLQCAWQARFQEEQHQHQHQHYPKTHQHQGHQNQDQDQQHQNQNHQSEQKQDDEHEYLQLLLLPEPAQSTPAPEPAGGTPSPPAPEPAASQHPAGLLDPSGSPLRGTPPQPLEPPLPAPPPSPPGPLPPERLISRLPCRARDLVAGDSCFSLQPAPPGLRLAAAMGPRASRGDNLVLHLGALAARAARVEAGEAPLDPTPEGVRSQHRPLSPEEVAAVLLGLSLNDVEGLIDARVRSMSGGLRRAAAQAAVAAAPDAVPLEGRVRPVPPVVMAGVHREAISTEELGVRHKALLELLGEEARPRGGEASVMRRGAGPPQGATAAANVNTLSAFRFAFGRGNSSGSGDNGGGGGGGDGGGEGELGEHLEVQRPLPPPALWWFLQQEEKERLASVTSGVMAQEGVDVGSRPSPLEQQQQQQQRMEGSLPGPVSGPAEGRLKDAESAVGDRDRPAPGAGPDTPTAAFAADTELSPGQMLGPALPPPPLQPYDHLDVCVQEISDPSDVRLGMMVDHVRQCTHVAVDSESYERLQGRRELSLVQILAPAAGRYPRTVYLLDLASAGGEAERCALMRAVAPALADPRVTKVLHGAENDGFAFRSQYGIRMARAVDLQQVFGLACLAWAGAPYVCAAQLRGLPRVRLGWTLAAMGVTLPHKDSFRSRYAREPRLWLRRPLTAEMREYAVQDVCFLLDAYRGLLRHLLRHPAAQPAFLLDPVRHLEVRTVPPLLCTAPPERLRELHRDIRMGQRAMAVAAATTTTTMTAAATAPAGSEAEAEAARALMALLRSGAGVGSGGVEGSEGVGDV